MERPLRFSVRELTELVTRRELVVSPEDLELPDGLQTEGPLEVTLELSGLRERVQIRATARLTVRLACVRCTTAVVRKLVASLEVVAERLPEGSQTDAEAPDGIVYYDGGTIDLTDEIRQILVLEIPTHPLCRDECRGFCAKCGADLNRGACDCSAAELTDPRWAALKALRAGNSDTSSARRRGRRDS